MRILAVIIVILLSFSFVNAEAIGMKATSTIEVNDAIDACPEGKVLCSDGGCKSECSTGIKPVARVTSSGSSGKYAVVRETVQNDPVRTAEAVVENQTEETDVRGWDPVVKEPVIEKPKPKKIAVVSGRLTESDDHNKWVLLDSIGPFEDIPRVNDYDELQTFAEALALMDENILNISMTSNQTFMAYERTARLLGFIGITYEILVDVDDAGRVKVKFPWYLAISKHDADRIELELKNSLNSTDEEDDLFRAQQTLQTISNVMK